VLTTLPPSCAVVMKSGNLDFVEPSGPLQACNGTALPLPLPLDLLQALGLWLPIQRIILAEIFFISLFHKLSNMLSYTILQYTKVFSWGLSSMDFLSNTPRTAVPLLLTYMVKSIVHSCYPLYQSNHELCIVHEREII